MYSVINICDSKKWDTIVKSFYNYDVNYLSGYAKAFQLNGDGEPFLFFYKDDNIRAINVVLKRDIGKDPHFVGNLPENTYFDFATPYGYGGWLMEGEGDHAPATQLYQNSGFTPFRTHMVKAIRGFQSDEN